ncbi:TetR/AcrR family transcriptional regulator [Ornithinimicrobium ciconiae]|uniref:TetR/AcrR family transcriptional regulator n=1 Tax=Ornithinimicrobium ciconiae TaxID=2594265 RepID=A0A516G8A4_9MICO|nr:TetR/AcrR family transcriptional regulator [Ornithinimicrobium ciconiae]QDO87758.1 TetR/AcrR family transcriptional regulator [Ornithinimicrobium ciconiae]
MSTRADGRDTRWAQHRAVRRRELVEAALRAIRRHGPSVGMDDISAEAGTSKTVIYRHFGDRTGLYSAVAESVDQRILDSLRTATADWNTQDPTALVGPMVDAYLSLVEKDPEIYRFVVTRPLLDGPVEHDPVAGLTDQIGAQVAQVLEAHLTLQGRDAACAQTWGHGLVGFVRAAADHWMDSERSRPRQDVVADVTSLFAPALSGMPSTHQTTHDQD